MLPCYYHFRKGYENGVARSAGLNEVIIRPGLILAGYACDNVLSVQGLYFLFLVHTHRRVVSKSFSV